MRLFRKLGLKGQGVWRPFSSVDTKVTTSHPEYLLYTEGDTGGRRRAIIRLTQERGSIRVEIEPREQLGSGGRPRACLRDHHQQDQADSVGKRRETPRLCVLDEHPAAALARPGGRVPVAAVPGSPA